MDAAVAAIVANDRVALARALTEPGAVRQGITEEHFLAAIVHQLYVGDTLLHVAAAAFRADMVDDLIAAGADVAARNRRGAQALHYAADANRHEPAAQGETIAALLKAGADPDARDKSGVAPLHRAVRTRGVTAVRALLDGGADVNLKNGSGSPPLFLARQTTGRGGSGSVEAKAAQGEIVQMLLASAAEA